MKQIPDEVYDVLVKYLDGDLEMEAIANVLFNWQQERTKSITILPTVANNLFAMFHEAQTHIKYPKITIPVPQWTVDTQKIALLYTIGGAFPGCINITDGRKFGENTWFGRIIEQDIKGYKHVRIMWSKATKNDVKALIQEILANPTDKLKAYGQEYKHCCFCGIELTNENSRAAGYGPICAGNYGLPWEGMAAAKEEEEVLSDMTDVLKKG